MEHELACLLCHKAASKITLRAQFSLPFPICLNEPIQAVSHWAKGGRDDCQSAASGGEDGDEWIDGRRKEEREV